MVRHADRSRSTRPKKRTAPARTTFLPDAGSVHGQFDLAEGDWTETSFQAQNEELGEWFQSIFSNSVRSLQLPGQGILEINCTFQRKVRRVKLVQALVATIRQAIGQEQLGQPPADIPGLNLAIRLVPLAKPHKTDTLRPLPPASPITAEIPSLSTPEQKLRNIDADYLRLRDETRYAIEQLLAERANKDFVSLEAKQDFVADIRERLRRFDLRIRCPKCQQPSMLRAVPHPDSKDGVFQFDHSSGTHGGGKRGDRKADTTLPPGLKVIDAPPDRRVKTVKPSQSLVT